MSNPMPDRQKPIRVVTLLIVTVMILFFLSRTIAFGYLPGAQYKSISISIEYKSANEEQIERVITGPLEKEISKLEGITEIYSVSDQDKARIYIRFFIETDLDQAYMDVREVVDRAYAQFPQGVHRPIISKSDIASRPAFIAAFERREHFTEEYLNGIFENVDGVGEILLGGAIHPEVQIAFDSEQLAKARVTIPQLLSLLRGGNIIGGFASEADLPHTLDARVKSLGELRGIPLSSGLTLGEIAEIHFSRAESDSVGRVNGSDKIVAYIHEAGDANTVRLCRRLAAVTKSLEGDILYNYGANIETALREILTAMLYGIASVTVLTFLLLRKLYPALLISLNIPFSMLFSAACLRLFGFEIDVMTLSGIAIGIGLVIDSGAIYVEEVLALDGDAKRALQNTLAPILFSSITTVSVFFPLLFAKKELVDQYGGLAVAVSSSIASSLVFVFFFMPSLLANLHKPQKAGPPDILSKHLSRCYFFIGKRRALFALGMVSLVFCALFVFFNTRQETFSIKEPAAISFNIEFTSGTSIEKVTRVTSRLEEEIRIIEGIKTFISRLERERACLDLALLPAADKKDVIARIRRLKPWVSDAFLYFPDEVVNEGSFDVLLTGQGNRRLRELAYRLADEIQRQIHPLGIVFHFKETLPSKYVAIDVNDALVLGLNPMDIYSEMYWSLSGPVASKWNPPRQSQAGAEYADIRLLAGNLRSASAFDLLTLKVRSSELTPIELAATATLHEKQEVGRIYHHDRQRSASFSVRTAMKEKQGILKKTLDLLEDFPFPEGYQAQAGLEEKEQSRLTNSAVFSLVLSIALILIILIFQFEQLRIPLIIMTQIPLSFILPLLLVKILHLPLSLPVVIGLILTAGISVNNAILVFDQLKDKTLSASPVLLAFQRKVRAMLIASLTTVMGVFPLLFTGASGTGMLAPLSLTIAVGILGSLAFLLVSLPVLFPLQRRG